MDEDKNSKVGILKFFKFRLKLFNWFHLLKYNYFYLVQPASLEAEGGEAEGGEAEEGEDEDVSIYSRILKLKILFNQINNYLLILE